MGVKDETGECIIGTSEGTVKARDFKRIADNAARWNAELVKSLRGPPWQPIPGRNEDTIPVRVRLAEEGSPILPNPDSIAAPRAEIKRRARISRSDVIRVGYTIGCPGCQAINRGDRESQNHTEECRARIEKALIEEGGIKGKRMTEGNERYNEHKSKRTRTDESGLRPGGAQTFTGPCNPSGNVAASSGHQREHNAKRGSDNADANSEHVRKYQKQEDETQDEDTEMGSGELQPDKQDSDCMFVEIWRDRISWVCQVQGGGPEYWDDLTGKHLDPEMVMKARGDEMGELAKHRI